MNLRQRMQHLNEIGIALSSERNLNRLLERIMAEARSFTRADAGTLYLVQGESRQLKYEIVQNDTLGMRFGGIGGGEIPWDPILPLFNPDGSPNYANVSAYVAASGETVNIPDVYATEYPLCVGLLADIDCNEQVGFSDITPFIALLVAGG